MAHFIAIFNLLLWSATHNIAKVRLYNKISLVEKRSLQIMKNVLRYIPYVYLKKVIKNKVNK